METSPLSLFEAVFKVIEERVPLGRHIVTIMSILMGAVIIVFCVGYLAEALTVPANWISLSIHTRSFAAIPHLSGHAWIYWLLVLVLSLYAGLVTLQFRQFVKTVREASRRLNEFSQRLREGAERSEAAAAQRIAETAARGTKPPASG